MWQFSFWSPTEHPPQFFKNVILIILCQLIFRIVFSEYSYVDVGKSFLICSWSAGVPGSFWRSDPLHRGTALWPLHSQGFSLLRHAYIPWLLSVPGSCLSCPFFVFQSIHLDSFVSARWNLPTPEARCLRSPSAGVLELLASCNGVSELLTPKREVLSVTSSRFLTIISSLPLAETSTAGSLVASVPLNGVPELPGPW
jgi:hypothetical protein